MVIQLSQRDIKGICLPNYTSGKCPVQVIGCCPWMLVASYAWCQVTLPFRWSVWGLFCWWDMLQPRSYCMPERLIFMGNDGNRHGFHFQVEGGLGWFYPIDPLFRRERTTFVASLLLLCFMENLHVLCYLKLNLYIWHDTFLVAHLTARIIHNMTIWNIEGGKGREMLKWDEFVQLNEAGLATWGVETRQGTSTS